MASRTTAASIKVPSSHVTNDFDGLWSTVLTYTTHISSWVLMNTCLFPFKVGLYHKLFKLATKHTWSQNNLQIDMREDDKEIKPKKPGQTHCWIAHFWFTVINNTSWKWWNTYTALTGNFQTDMGVSQETGTQNRGMHCWIAHPCFNHSAFTENLQYDLRKDQEKLTQNRICLMQMTNAGIKQWMKASKMA